MTRNITATELEASDRANYEALQNITFEDWEAKQVQDPEFRATVEKLEAGYQNERRPMNQTEQVTSITGADIDAAVQDERMVELERRIERLEQQVARIEAEAISNLSIFERGERIKKLEAALRNERRR